MNNAKKLPELRTFDRPSLPVSIPIHIYHKVLSMASEKSDPKNQSDPQISSDKEQKENQPKKEIVITKNKKSVEKSTMTETNKEEKCKYSQFTSDQELHNLLDHFLTMARQKKIVHVNMSTQTDDVLILPQEERTDNEESEARSKGTRLQNGAGTLNDIQYLSQEFKNFLVEIYSSSQKLFKENIINNKRILMYSHDKRRLFLKIVDTAVDLITCDEKASKDMPNYASAAADMVNLVVNRNNNNKETPATQTETMQSIIQQNETAVFEGNNNVQEETSNIEQNYIGEQCEQNTLSQSDPQPQPTVNFTNEGPYEIVQQNNVLNAQINCNNNAFNPQTARRYTRTPRPQVMHQQQLYNAGYVFDHQNKMFRYPGKTNIRPTPYQQKTQKRKTGQQQGEPVQAVPMQHGYYQANPQQLIHHQMQYQQSFH